MNLISIYELPDRHALLYKLLSERDETINISHKAMPRWEDHVRFVESHPYQGWYFITTLCCSAVGACYLTSGNEIGVAILKKYQGEGYGTQAIKEIMRLHGTRRYLANINPRNEPSARVFSNLGFKLIQNTYEIKA